MWRLLASLGMGILSGLVPGIPLEVWLGGLGTLVDQVGIWPLALACGLGQALGKVPWYGLGRWSLGWPWMRRQLAKPGVAPRYDRLLDWTMNHPGAAQVAMLLSATLGLPPLALFIVVAGQVRLSLPLTLLTMTVRRALRFAATLGAFGWLVSALG